MQLLGKTGQEGGLQSRLPLFISQPAVPQLSASLPWLHVRLTWGYFKTGLPGSHPQKFLFNSFGVEFPKVRKLLR